MYAPIVIFCFINDKGLRRLVESLLTNPEAEHSTVIFYSDGQKRDEDKHRVARIRSYLQELKGFKSVKLCFRDRNFGLKDNIEMGITEVLKEHRSCIVLEDDLIVSNHFLCFMNKGLILYACDERVWHISGWTYDIPGLTDEFYFIPKMTCWGWATWADRWDHSNFNYRKILKNFKVRHFKTLSIEFSNFGYIAQLLLNAVGILNTWAIAWYANIVENDGLCLYPRKSLCSPSDFNIESENVNSKSIYSDLDNYASSKINIKYSEPFESPLAIMEIKKFYRLNRPPLRKRLTAYTSLVKKVIVQRLFAP